MKRSTTHTNSAARFPGKTVGKPTGKTAGKNVGKFAGMLATAAAASMAASCMLNTAPAPAQERTSVETIYTPGYTVAALPSAHTVVTRGGTRYYVVDGTYYRATQSGYMVVPRPL